MYIYSCCTGFYDLTEESPHWSVGNGTPAAPHIPGEAGQAKAVVLHKDPIMLLNEHCQRNQLKVRNTFQNSVHN